MIGYKPTIRPTISQQFNSKRSNNLCQAPCIDAYLHHFKCITGFCEEIAGEKQLSSVNNFAPFKLGILTV